MAAIRANRYEMYMVDNAGKKDKQSPDKTAYAESIFRGPTFIIERNGNRKDNRGTCRKLRDGFAQTFYRAKLFTGLLLSKPCSGIRTFRPVRKA